MSAEAGRVFRRQGGGVVKLEAMALGRMLGFQQLGACQPEAGGVLLGRCILRCQDVVIDEVTSPMPGDVRGPVTFNRSRPGHQRAIDERWHSSGGTCLYLGEWHTHPEPHPWPSQVDLGDWRRRLREDQFDGESLFFVIVGTREVRVWEGDRRSREVVLLPPRDS